jgi:predicted transcriptional regulator of viral defense system
MRALGRQRTLTSLAMVALLFGNGAYYVGGRSAASLHHLTTQRFHSLVDVYTDEKLYVRHLGAARLVVHPLPRAGTDWGMITTRAQDIEVRVSDPERTVTDLVDRLDRLLGWAETQQLTLDAFADRRLDVERLVRYATRWQKQSTAARLGVLLDRAGVDERLLLPLIDTFASSRAQTALVPSRPRRGPWDSRFRVILNDQQTGADAGAADA